MHKLERTTFESSRAPKYSPARELQTQTGQPISNFSSVVALEELLDNAPDACEMANTGKVSCRVEGSTRRSTEHHTRPETEAYDRLLVEKGEMLSKAVQTFLKEAMLAAYTYHLIHNVSFHPEESDEQRSG